MFETDSILQTTNQEGLEDYQHILLSSQCFQKLYLYGSVQFQYCMVKSHTYIIQYLFMLYFFCLQGKCQRKEPPCKYLHPPQHLREQLLQNGRNNLILRNLQVQAAQQAALNQSIVSGGLIPIVSL